MTLTEYLEQRGASQKLAAKSGITAGEISRIKNGKKKATFQNAAMIEFGSDGLVKIESLLEDQHLRTVAAFIRANVSQ